MFRLSFTSEFSIAVAIAGSKSECGVAILSSMLSLLSADLILFLFLLLLLLPLSLSLLTLSLHDDDDNDDDERNTE